MIRMIIVDDEIDSAKLLQKRLLRDLQSEDKLTIELVQSVEEAAPRIQVASPPFDIVLADNSLGPGREGLDWLEELRKEHPDIDCILFTDLNESVAERAAEAGTYRYLTQPVEPKELIWCVRSLIKQRVTDFERQWLALVNQIGAKLQPRYPYG